MKKIFGIVGLVAAGVQAAGLKEAEFTRVINDVKILPVETTPSPAKVGDRITGRTAVSTGVQSRAELRYPDKTLTRLGANSLFRMDQTTRTIEVEKGVILLQVPKQLGGAQVRTTAVTAAVTGTTLLVEFTADGYFKLIVIEGEVEVFLNERRSAFRTLTAGDLWMTRSDDKSSLPLPVKVDLKRLHKTSKLLNDAEFSALGNEKQVQKALEVQAKQKMDGELLATAFQIEGRGRQLTLTQGDRAHTLGAGLPQARRLPVSSDNEFVSRKAARMPAPVVVEPSEPNAPVNVPQSTVFDNKSRIVTSVPQTTSSYNSAVDAFGNLPGSRYVPATDGPFGNYMYDDPLAFAGIDQALASQDSWFVFKGDEIYLSGGIVVDTTGGPRGLILGAAQDFRFTEHPPFPAEGITPGNELALASSTNALVATSRSGSIHFGEFTLTGAAQDVLFHADGPASDVNVIGTNQARIQIPQGTFTAHAGRDVNVTNASVGARAVNLTAGRDVKLGDSSGGSARIEAAESIRIQAGGSLRISSSSQLRRLAQADNPQVSLEAIQGSLEIDDKSLIEGDVVNLASRQGDIRITGSTISAREIKARVFDGGGVLWLHSANLGHGTNPSELIRLYGESAAGVRFSGDTTLRGTAVEIAGRNVTIDTGHRVRLANPGGTRVFADLHNYNNGTHGNFTGLDGAAPVEVNKNAYGNRPGF